MDGMRKRFAMALWMVGAVGPVYAQQFIDLPSCADSPPPARRIVSHLNLVRFSIPRLAKMTRGSDADYVQYQVRYGPARDNLWLKFMWGTAVGGSTPRLLNDPSIQWQSKKWLFLGKDIATDWIGKQPGGRKWRHLAIPFGFAAYEAAPPAAAQYFDRILDSACRP